MKRILLLFTVFSLLFSLNSCEAERDAYMMLTEFISAYGADGIIYSPAISEGENGYIRDGLIEKIYVFSGEFPHNFAVFLNSRPDFGSECGVFVCLGAEQCAMVEEACFERIRLIGRGNDCAFVKRQGNTVFYSTMTDKERAERLWREIIR